MTWFDVVALLLVVLVAWLESIRGFGRALVDLVGAVIVVRLVPMLSGMLADSVAVAGAPEGNRAFWFALLFVVFAALVVLAARLIYNTTLLSLEYFDPIVGALFGLASGLIVAFAFLHTLQLGYGTTEPGKILAGSFMGQELLSMRSLHRLMTALYKLGE